MNLAKSVLGLLLVGIAVLVVGIVPVNARQLALIAGSGVLGIAVGDTLFFMALVRLDPRLTLLLATVGQVLTVLAAVVVLGERPGWAAAAGIALVLGGVAWVMLERADAAGQDKPRLVAGIACGIGSAVAMSAGLLLAKVALAEVPALQATWIRLAAGAAAIAVGAALRGHLAADLRAATDPALLRSLVVAVTVVMFGGFWLSLVALELTDATIALALGATEPLFILPLAVLWLGEQVSRRALLGAAVAVTGTIVILSTAV